MKTDIQEGVIAQRPFSLKLFVVTVTASLAGIFGIFAFAAPARWAQENSASFGAMCLTFISLHLLNSFAEYYFHRYVLHAPLIPFLQRFYIQHTRHHALTRIVRKPHGVENRYPILESSQYEASFFPWYSLIVFAAVASPVYYLAKIVAPSAPIFFCGYLSIAWSLVLYEVLHAIEHWPLERWGPLVSHKRWGKMWKVIYGFHLRHHADIHSNEAISGFFGLPVADFVFGTWKNPSSLYTEGSQLPAEEFRSRPARFIAWLDKLAERRVQRLRLSRS